MHNNEQNLASIIEALLFVAGEPLSVTKLAELSASSVPDIEEVLTELENVRARRGICLLRKEELVTLVTASQAAPYVEKLIKEEILGDLSKAALETLTIIAYRHPIMRSEIDYIRGVNSSFTIRNLTARGLVERMPVSAGRGYHYHPTLEFMKFLGIASFQELPEFETVQNELQQGVENRLNDEA